MASNSQEREGGEREGGKEKREGSGRETRVG
jgi:hypothetical protein